MRKLLIIGSLLVPLAAGTAFTEKATAAEKPRSAISLECSKRADAQKLHGKERRKFRASCKHELAKKG
jgi:hypothetical protein